MFNTSVLNNRYKTHSWIKGHNKLFECGQILAKFKVGMRTVEQNTEDCLSSTGIINNLTLKFTFYS